MASTILGTDYVTRVCKRLGVLETDLTVAEIDEVLSPEEIELIDMFPDWQTFEEREKTLFENADVCAIAAKCCPILKTKIPKSEKTPFYNSESSEDWDVKQTKLEELRDKYIAMVSPSTVNFFAVAGPTRAGYWDGGIDEL